MWKEAKAAFAKRTPVELTHAADSPSIAQKANRAEPSAEQQGRGNGCPFGRCCQGYSPNHYPPTPYRRLTPARIEVTNTSKKGKIAKSASKDTVGPQQVPVTKSKKPATSAEPSQT